MMHDVVVGIKALDKGTPTSTSEHVEPLHLLTFWIQFTKAKVNGRPPGADSVGSGCAPGEGIEPLGGGNVGHQRLIEK